MLLPLRTHSVVTMKPRALKCDTLRVLSFFGSLCLWNSTQSVSFPLSDVDFELLNTEFIVDLCFGFRKPNSCVGFTGLDLNLFGTTVTTL